MAKTSKKNGKKNGKIDKKSKTKKKSETVITSDLYHYDSSYDIVEIPDFLTSDECELLMKISRIVGLEKSKVVDKDGNIVLDNSRSSYTVWLQDNNDIVQSISKKISLLTNTPIEHQEKLQVVKYDTGGTFEDHYDYAPTVHRLSTFLIYLNDNFTGGDTTFPLINKTVTPEKGKAIYFYNVDKTNHKIIYESLHRGSPVSSGNKWIVNKWIQLSPVK